MNMAKKTILAPWASLRLGRRPHSNELTLLNLREGKKTSNGHILDMPSPTTRCYIPIPLSHRLATIQRTAGKIRSLNRLLAGWLTKALKTLSNKASCRHTIANQCNNKQLTLNALQEKEHTVTLKPRRIVNHDLALAPPRPWPAQDLLIRLNCLSDEIDTRLPAGGSPAVELAGRMITELPGVD